MCSPALVVQGVVSVAQVAQDKQNQKKGRAYQEQVQQRTTASANANAASAYTALERRSEQARDAAALSMQRSAKEAEAAMARVRVSGAARGVGGQTLGDVMQSVQVQAAEYQAVRAKQLDWEQLQILSAMDDVRVQQQNQINSGAGGPVAGPNYTAILGQLAGSIAGFYANEPTVKDTSVANPASLERSFGARDYGTSFGPYSDGYRL